MNELPCPGHRAVRGHLGMDPQRRRARHHRQREGQFRPPAGAADPPGQRPVLAMAPGHRAVAVGAGVRESCARSAVRGPGHRPPAVAERGRTARRPATAKSVLRQGNVPHLFGIRGILENSTTSCAQPCPAPHRLAGTDLGIAFLWIMLADRGFSPVEVILARLALGAAAPFAIVVARREAVPRSVRLWAPIPVAALFASAVNAHIAGPARGGRQGHAQVGFRTLWTLLSGKCHITACCITPGR
jgi:hypothetical protein